MYIIILFTSVLELSLIVLAETNILYKNSIVSSNTILEHSNKYCVLNHFALLMVLVSSNTMLYSSKQDGSLYTHAYSD